MGKLSSHALPSFDSKDRKILYELEQDCRRSLGEIAERTGLSKQTLHYRMQRLVDGGVIAGFITAIDPAKLGYVNHRVLMQLGELDEAKRKVFLDFLIAHGNVSHVASCEGKFDIAITVLAENLVQFNAIFRAILKEFPGRVKNHDVGMAYELADYPRTHLISDKKERKPALASGEPKRIELDGGDVRILSALSKNARIPTIELADVAGLSPNTVRQKIRRLEKEGVIRRYTILLQHSRIGLQNYEMLISTQNLTDEDEKGIEDFCRMNDRVTSMRKGVGRWDIGIGFDADSSAHFQEFLTGFRSRFSNLIREFEYVPILQVHKLDHFPMREI